MYDCKNTECVVNQLHRISESKAMKDRMHIQELNGAIDPTSLLTGALQKKNNRETTEKKDPVETSETLKDYTEVTE